VTILSELKQIVCVSTFRFIRKFHVAYQNSYYSIKTNKFNNVNTCELIDRQSSHLPNAQKATG
jgi:hypothetical protein